MLNITKLFSDKDPTKIDMTKKSVPSPSLTQGRKFKKYQKKVENSLEKNAASLSGKEGFTDMNLTEQSNNVIRSNTITSSKEQNIQQLRNEYQNTLEQYEKLVAQISGNVSNYINRANINNPYLNKTIQFTTGQICYVTNKGVAKYIPSTDILNSLNIPKNYIKVNIPWDNSYLIPGTTIPTKPPLISGTNAEKGQTFGNEGSNIFVNQFLPKNITPKYIGCYNSNNNLTFIGGSPPSSDVSIQNGNFSQSQIPNNSYEYLTWNTTDVPGWNFNCVLLNNSVAWGFPIPYPNGNQCACIQRNQELWTSVWIPFVAGTSYTLSFSACGRNCCDGSNQANPINIGLEGNTFYTLNAVVGQWQTYTTTFTPQTSGGQRLSFIGNWTSSDRSTAIQGVSLNVSANGTYSYSDCEQAAINSGNRYFALQNVNTSTGLGYCAVSNSEPAIKQYGVSKVPSKAIEIWSSNTGNQTGNTAILSNTGSLQVINSGGQAIYSSPSTNANPSNYLGCYGDKSTRAMSKMWSNGSRKYNNDQCQQIAQQNGYQFYGLQNSTSGTNAQCFLSNNLSQTIQYGKATNCTQVSDGSWSGGGWSNAVYNTTLPQSNYFLILQDDGNMCVYRGTGPKDNQGLIWATQTNGKQQTANPQMVSTNGKYGKNWIASGATLAPGDFIGSNDGKIALVMQSDGNLVLYTYQMETNCQKMSDGNMGGGVGANASYDIGKSSISGNMGKLGYIDENSKLYTYPSTNQQYNNTYTTIANVDTPGNDISGASFSNATVESCQTACNNNNECAGFVMNGNTCLPKTNEMYPFGSNSQPNLNTTIYIKGKQPTTPPLGVSQNTLNTDTITYQNYINGGDIGKKYGLANINTTQKQQLEHLQTKMNLLSKEITKLTTDFQTGVSGKENFQTNINSVVEQSRDNIIGLQRYESELLNINQRVQSMSNDISGNIENILKDSDIIVLQKNYEYLLWSILAAGTVIVSMNVLKKQ